jgi:NAD(P)-dependent dehydrogenase (short-subunit alcohol dehydrogenase family)
MSKPTAVVVGVGAEQGVGAAVARRFAQEGHHVLVAGRTLTKIEQVVTTIASCGGSAEAVLTDATREADVVALFDRAMAPGQGRAPVDLVVFNAGNNQKVDFREVTIKLFEDF